MEMETWKLRHYKVQYISTDKAKNVQCIDLFESKGNNRSIESHVTESCDRDPKMYRPPNNREPPDLTYSSLVPCSRQFKSIIYDLVSRFGSGWKCVKVKQSTWKRVSVVDQSTIHSQHRLSPWKAALWMEISTSLLLRWLWTNATFKDLKCISTNQ